MNGNRPDRDTLLGVVQKDETRQQRGKLKLFFGMAAGVGKTYAMLEAARQLKADGLDVVIGYVETHNHPETDELLNELEIIPLQKLEYRGATLEEMDLDAILARQPELVLVDELAHTNVPGTRHVKRWQDVIEILQTGIGVYTTVNVQHFESRTDAVRQITGITVHETVPDSLLDLADEIELIDLSPEDLRKRLAEGRVYTQERSELAANNFFRIGNLTALREMALRLTAEHVDHKLQQYMQIKHIPGPWKSGERLMVAIGPSPFSAQLIRWTRRMAYNLEAPWLAVYVETSQMLSGKAQENLARNLALAREMGGEVVTTAGENITETLLHLAHQHNVTQVVVGKPMRRSLREFLQGTSLVSELIRASGEIDIYVVTGDKHALDNRPRIGFPQPISHSSWKQYVWALIIVGIITSIDLILLNALPWVSYLAVGLTELVTVLLIAVYIGRGPALLAALVSAFSWNFLFIHPQFTFAISQIQDIILFFLYFVIAIFTGNLTARIRTQERQARYNADRTMALYTLAHDTATAVNMDDVLRTAVTQIGRVFDADVVILLLESGRLARQPHPASTFTMDERDYNTALWVFENGKPAGRFTNTLPSADAQYFPLITSSRIVGVIGIRTHRNQRMSFDQEALLETFINQIGLVIERELLDEAAEQAAMLRESERLYTTLFNSISHELRTPIAAITGAASSLMDTQAGASEDTRSELVGNIQGAAERLNRLVENLLDMSRLESGRLSLKRDWCDIGDIISVAVKHFDDCFVERPLTMHLAPQLPLVQVDFVLVEQVLINLLHNACTYTPQHTRITIDARQPDQCVEIHISDDGQGIPEADLERIFDKFYRVPGTATGGTGLGLSISRGLIEAHEGTLTAENQPEGGARFVIRLPLNGTPPPVKESNL